MRIIITGGNSGVGKATATTAAESGHSVVIACRTIEKADLTADGFEADMGTNHLGHFALTSCSATSSRTGLSRGQRDVPLRSDPFRRPELQTRRYSAMAAYGKSKLTNVLFVRAYASDPRTTDTGITRSSAGRLPVGERNPVWTSCRPRPGCPGEPSGVDDRSAQRNVSGAAVQPVGQASGHRFAQEGPRPSGGRSALGIVGRADGLRLAVRP